MKVFLKPKKFLFSVCVSVVGMMFITQAAINDVQKEQLSKFIEEVRLEDRNSLKELNFGTEFLLKVQTLRQQGDSWEVPFNVIRHASGVTTERLLHNEVCTAEGQCSCSQQRPISCTTGPSRMLGSFDLLAIIGRNNNADCQYLKTHNFFPDSEQYKTDEHGYLLGYLKRHVFAKLQMSSHLVKRLYQGGKASVEVTAFLAKEPSKRLSKKEYIKELETDFRRYITEVEAVSDVFVDELERVKLALESQSQEVIKKIKHAIGKEIALSFEDLERLIKQNRNRLKWMQNKSDVAQFMREIFDTGQSNANTEGDFFQSQDHKGEHKERVLGDDEVLNCNEFPSLDDNVQGNDLRVLKLGRMPLLYFEKLFGPCCSINPFTVKELDHIFALQRIIKQVYTLNVGRHLYKMDFLLSLRMGLLFQGLFCCEELHAVLLFWTHVVETVEKYRFERMEQTITVLQETINGLQRDNEQTRVNMETRLRETREQEQERTRATLKQEREATEKEVTKVRDEAAQALAQFEKQSFKEAQKIRQEMNQSIDERVNKAIEEQRQAFFSYFSRNKPKLGGKKGRRKGRMIKGPQVPAINYEQYPSSSSSSSSSSTSLYSSSHSSSSSSSSSSSNVDFNSSFLTMALSTQPSNESEDDEQSLSSDTGSLNSLEEALSSRTDYASSLQLPHADREDDNDLDGNADAQDGTVTDGTDNQDWQIIGNKQN